MLIFVIAAVTAYSLGEQLAVSPLRVFSFLRRHIDGAKIVLLALTILVLLLILFVVETGSLEFQFFGLARRFASSPETVHALLGAVAGLMLRAFYHGSVDARENPSTLRLIYLCLRVLSGGAGCAGRSIRIRTTWPTDRT
jgi:uncharacterized integral membrane protein